MLPIISLRDKPVRVKALLKSCKENQLVSRTEKDSLTRGNHYHEGPLEAAM